MFFNLFKKKPIEKICKNCKLFNPQNNTCRIIVLHEGKKLHIPVDPNDPCFFHDELNTKEEETFIPIDDVKQMRFWVENPLTGEQDTQGIVKIEYPVEDTIEDLED